ncbi:valine--tRNA ligase [Cerasicoccus frondis]|uniref:valine--tRNA ligase n=1 Tax=Cerasicoccus frondis TaxID=490090 RepID=UPI002852D2B4|nr:valine--tRNA ligase [Cerasicoccus frondis]
MSDLAKAYEPKAVEEKWYAQWESAGCFKGQLPVASETEGGTASPEAHSIVIPPPNVTGVLHMGHILNNTIQDILTRRARQQGKAAVWVPGTDHAGIATQTRVEKKLREQGKTKWDLGREAFIEEAKQWRDEHGGIILKQLRKLGASCDWDRTVHTLDDGYSRAVLTAFVELYHKGHIYRGKRMVNWCPKSLTALSDEEVIMKPQKGFLYKMKYAIAERPGEFVEISTTRPETLMGDTAVAINPNDERYKHLHGLHVIRPFPEAKIPFVLDEHVDLEFGTGVLKVTPAHDRADFEIGQRHNLEVIDVLTPDGKINCPDCPELHGKDRFEARKLAADMLEEMGLLVDREKYENNVGFSERADVPIEPRLSDQWWMKYPKIEEAKQVVRDGKIKFYPERWTKTYLHWLENIQDWCISRQLWWGHRIPVWYAKGIDRNALSDEDLKDPTKVFVGVDGPSDPENWEQEDDVLDTWASSWLWPFGVFGWPRKWSDAKLLKAYQGPAYDWDGNITDVDFAEGQNGFFAYDQEKKRLQFGDAEQSDGVFTVIHEKLGKRIGIPVNLDEVEIGPGSDAQILSQKELDFWYPTQALATGPDIIFFWVARMIMAGLEFMGEVPFKNVIFNGIIRDAQGRKMSKSLGNSPDPLDLIEKFGADGLRLGMLMIAPKGADILFSEDRIQLGRNFCNKLWNACRFRLMQQPNVAELKTDPNVFDMGDVGNILSSMNANKRDLDSIIGRLEFDKFDADDHAILAKLLDALAGYDASFETYEFNRTTDTLYNFFWNDFCDWYVEVSKSKAQSDELRGNCLAIQDLCLRSVIQMLHPITPFITEELWSTLGFGEGFIHETTIPTADGLRAQLAAAGVTLDAAAIAEVAKLQDFVNQARALKAQYSLAAKNDVTFFLVADEGDKVVVDSHLSKLRKLAGAGAIEHRDDVQNMPAMVSQLGTLYLDLAGSVDVEAEIAKIDKQLVGLDKAIKGAENKLMNDKFVNNAPAEVIDGVKQTLADNKAKAEELRKLKAGLAG